MATRAPTEAGLYPPPGSGMAQAVDPATVAPVTATRAARPSRVSKLVPRRRMVQGRRVRRVIRRIDTWTVLKLSVLFYLCMCLVLLIAGVILWNIATSLNVITNVEKFIRSLFDLQTFKLHARPILEGSAAAAGLLVVLGTGANVLVALLYNLISDVIGGVQVIVLEETTAVDGPEAPDNVSVP